MDTSVFVFAYDMHDEGYGQVLDTIQQRSGAAGVTLACNYHHARDVFPHNPVRKIRFHEGGAIFFRPQDNHYAGLKMQPYVSSIVAEKDPLETALQEAERRGMEVRAWTNNLHNTSFASRYPQCAVYNAFGDPYITYLCPANPKFCAFGTRVLRHKSGIPSCKVGRDSSPSTRAPERATSLKKLHSMPLRTLTPSITCHIMQKERRTRYKSAALYRVGKENE